MNRKMSILLLAVFLMIGCTGTQPHTDLIVKVSRHIYSPNIDISKHAEYRGHVMILDSIEVAEHPDITNFYYLNPDQSIGYILYYSHTSMQQPVASFFWYALEKAFESVGIQIKYSGPLKNVAELHLKILTLTDQEANFRVSLLRNGLLLLQKDIQVLQKLPVTTDAEELEKRQYAFLDLMVDTILSDPDFKREFFSEKARI